LSGYNTTTGPIYALRWETRGEIEGRRLVPKQREKPRVRELRVLLCKAGRCAPSPKRRDKHEEESGSKKRKGGPKEFLTVGFAGDGPRGGRSPAGEDYQQAKRAKYRRWRE